MAPHTPQRSRRPGSTEAPLDVAPAYAVDPGLDAATNQAWCSLGISRSGEAAHRG
jgi:hypothetical protein